MSKAADIADKIRGLSPGEQLRLAAGLLDEARDAGHDMKKRLNAMRCAQAIASAVVLEVNAVLMDCDAKMRLAK